MISSDSVTKILRAFLANVMFITLLNVMFQTTVHSMCKSKRCCKNSFVNLFSDSYLILKLILCIYDRLKDSRYKIGHSEKQTNICEYDVGRTDVCVDARCIDVRTAGQNVTTWRVRQSHLRSTHTKSSIITLNYLVKFSISNLSTGWSTP